MAKELPFFKFEPNQWENGNIQMCSRELKGLFIDLCSMYWSRLGDLPMKLAVQKLCAGNASNINELANENIVELVDGCIVIQFLDEQLHDCGKTRENRKIAGIKGGEARAKTAKEARIKGRQFYVIHCFNDEESFLKIGVTAESISRRFSGKMPYEYNVVFQFSTHEYLQLELDCRDVIKDFTYQPKKYFSGYLESYAVECIDQLNEFLTFRTSFAIAKGLVSQSRKEKMRGEKTKEDIQPAADASVSTAPAFDFKKSLIGLGVSPEIAKQWLQVRKTRKATNTEIAFKKVQREIANSGRTPDECIRFSVEMSWGGFEAAWMQKELNRKNGSQHAGSPARQTHLNSGDGIDWSTQTVE